MSMTKLERETHNILTDALIEEGHSTYASYFQLFELHLIPRTNTHSIAYMIPDKGVIYLNEGITDLDMASLLIRHEMMHQYLEHGRRAIEYLKSKGKNDNNQLHKLCNYAADLELSKYYSRKIDPNSKKWYDYDLAKNIHFGTSKSDKDYLELGKGLVLELDHKDWFDQDLTFEEMLDKLLEENENLENFLKSMSNMLNDMNEEQQQAAENYHDSQQLKEKASQLKKQAQKLRKQNQDNTSEELEKQAEELEKQAEQVEKGIEKMPPSFTEQGKEAEEEIQDKLQKIKDFWNDVNKKQNEKEEKEAELKRIYKNNERKEKLKAYQKAKELPLKPFSNFYLDIINAIRKQTIEVDQYTDTYTKVNRQTFPWSLKTGVLRPAQAKIDPKKQKLIRLNVYIDYSGSWLPKEKREAGDKAVATLEQKYGEKSKHPKLKITKYYVTSTVTPFEEGKPKDGTGANGPAIIDDIKKTHPDNVLILTDSDANSSQSDSVDIPGCAWFLFYDDYAPNLYNAIKAKRGKFVYDIHDNKLTKHTENE